MVLLDNCWSTTFSAAWSMTLQMRPWETDSGVKNCSCIHVESCHRLLWGVCYWLHHLTVWNTSGFVTGPRVKGFLDSCVLVVTHLLVTHMCGKVQYTQRLILGVKPVSSERMCMERIKSVYSCLFMRVHLEPELDQEACILCPNAPGNAQQEGPV